MTAARTEVHEALEALDALRDKVSDAERATVDRIIALLSSLGDEVSELSERVRWLIGAPYRKKAEGVDPILNLRRTGNPDRFQLVRGA